MLFRSSSIPSGDPSSIPSGDPSSIPSGDPSSIPSGDPSSIPRGDPSSIPGDSFPNASLPNISASNLLKHLLDVFSSPLSLNPRYQLLYEDLRFRGYQQLGSCREFELLLKTRIPTTLITQYPVSMTLYSINENQMLTLSTPFDPWKLRNEIWNVTCEDLDVLWSLLTHLQSLSSSQF